MDDAINRLTHIFETLKYKHVVAELFEFLVKATDVRSILGVSHRHHLQTSTRDEHIQSTRIISLASHRLHSLGSRLGLCDGWCHNVTSTLCRQCLVTPSRPIPPTLHSKNSRLHVSMDTHAYAMKSSDLYKSIHLQISIHQAPMAIHWSHCTPMEIHADP